VSPGFFEAPEDFVVEEIPSYEPSGEGGHTFLWIEKRLRNSEEVARSLAREAGVPARDVGYAGRKDRFAVTRQHFSVPGLDPERAAALALPGAVVLRAARHPHKLRTGHLRGNRFWLRVHGVDAVLAASAESRATVLARVGMPNRFGDQRFGRGGANVERGVRLLAGASGRADRREARFLVSAVQAAVFNEVLAARPLPLDQVEMGDLARRTDSGGLFLVEEPAIDNERASRFEISATGPLFGTRMERPGEAVDARERVAIERLGMPAGTLTPPRGVRLRGGRRPVRVPVSELGLEGDGDELRLEFTLPAGSYATVLLEELLGFVPARSSSGLSSAP
jgi:tRNA pseudouridine13 synthase